MGRTRGHRAGWLGGEGSWVGGPPCSVDGDGYGGSPVGCVPRSLGWWTLSHVLFCASSNFCPCLRPQGVRVRGPSTQAWLCGSSLNERKLLSQGSGPALSPSQTPSGPLLGGPEPGLQRQGQGQDRNLSRWLRCHSASSPPCLLPSE